MKMISAKFKADSKVLQLGKRTALYGRAKASTEMFVYTAPLCAWVWLVQCMFSFIIPHKKSTSTDCTEDRFTAAPKPFILCPEIIVDVRKTEALELLSLHCLFPGLKIFTEGAPPPLYDYLHVPDAERPFDVHFCPKAPKSVFCFPSH